MAFLPSRTPDDVKALREKGRLLWDEFGTLRQGDAERLQRYRDFENEYEAQRNTDVYGNVTDYGRNLGAATQRRHDIRLPYAHAITTKHAYRVAGRSPDLIVPRRNSTPPEQYRGDTIEKILYSAYGVSESQLQFASGGHDGSLLGAACLDLYFDPIYQLPIFRSIYPGSVLVVQGVENPHDFKRAYRFWQVPLASFRAEYAGKEFADGQTINDVQADESGLSDAVTLVKMSDATHTYLLAPRGVVIDARQHDYGFVPYVVIPNLGPNRKLWGYADYEFYRHVAAYFEALMSRQADVIRTAANGSYTESGTGQSPKAILKALREGGIIPSRKDGEVKPVQVAEMPRFVDTHFQMVRQAMDELGFTPAAAWGTLGAASGSDRALQLGPQIELTALKQIHWSAGLKRLNTMILRMVERKADGRVTYTGVHSRKHVNTPFAIVLDAASRAQDEMFDENGQPIIDVTTGEPYTVPTNPAELIGGDYCTEVRWERRIDRDDPQFILSELNKFAQGAQSLYTTLANLGVEQPEDEMRLIEQEAKRFPWLRQGMIALIQQQLDAQNQQSDPSASQPGDLSSGLQALLNGGGGQSGANTFDAMSRGLNGSERGGGRSQGGVPGATYGGA